MLALVSMSDIDGTSIDGQLLRVFLAVLEEGSVTRASVRMELTQSAVSHALQRLARIAGQPLFVKSGRGIVATAAAVRLGPQARELLQSMRKFSVRTTFDLAKTRFDLTIAANDLQRDVLLPSLYQRLSHSALEARIRVIPSEVPSTDLLRRDRCDLLITPLPPEASDIVQRRLFDDEYVCFYDGTARSAPRSEAEFLGAHHATVIYPDGDRLQFDKDFERMGLDRRFSVAAPSFVGVSAFIRGSDLLTTMPSRLRDSVMRGFDHCRIPLAANRRKGLRPLVMYLAWHRSRHDDPALAWVRSQLLEIAKKSVPTVSRGSTP